MVDAVLALFTLPLPELSGLQRAGLLLPLTACIAVVYKALRCETPREIPLASVILWVTILIGMYMVGIGLMVVYQLLS